MRQCLCCHQDELVLLVSGAAQTQRAYAGPFQQHIWTVLTHAAGLLLWQEPSMC